MRYSEAPTIKTIASSQSLQTEVAKAFNALLVRKNRGSGNPATLWAGFIADLTAIGDQLANPAEPEAKVAPQKAAAKQVAPAPAAQTAPVAAEPAKA